MKRIRLSHSLISAWESGNIQGAIDMYFHVDRVGSQQMIDGRAFHEEIAESINKYNSLPAYMEFQPKLVTPKTEFEITVPYNEICDIKGIFDCLDEPNLYEWKTGVSDSLEWARTGQLPLYFLICELAKIPVDLAYLLRHNQYEKKSDLAIIHNSVKLRDKARNIVDSVAPEIHKYFLDCGLI
jgi:hypothetical protein